jgi:ferredoxin
MHSPTAFGHSLWSTSGRFACCHARTKSFLWVTLYPLCLENPAPKADSQKASSCRRQVHFGATLTSYFLLFVTTHSAELQLAARTARLVRPAEHEHGLRNWGVPAGKCTHGNLRLSRSYYSGMSQVDHTPHQPKGAQGSGLPVSLARSGITAAWDSKFASLLKLAEACDVPVRWSCRTGVCHTCMAGLIAGSLVYNPEPLERPAPGNVLVCCSQPNAGVTLDV